MLDQVSALAATGRVRPRVVSFEPIPLVGPPRLRATQLAAIERAVEPAIRDGHADAFAAMASEGPSDIPTARLPIASGAAPGRGSDHGAISRSVALLALGDRLTRTGRLPDIVHAHTGYPDGAAAAVLAARIDRPLIITEHSSSVGQVLSRPATRLCYEAGIARAEYVIAVSETLAAELRLSIPDLADPMAARLKVIPNAVAVDEFSTATFAERRPDELLFVGYRKPTKGIACLLQAFAQVHARRPTSSLTLIGRSPTPDVEAGWVAMATELGIAGAVRFEGPSDRAGVAQALRRASVFVHPSPRETFGVVAVEALAAGLPVVAADSGGVTEILGAHPEQLGAVVPSEDPAAMAAAIIGVLERRETFDPGTLRSSVSRYSGPIVAGHLIDVYETVMETAPGSTRGILPDHTAVLGEEGERRRRRPIVVAGFTQIDAERILGPLPVAVRASIRIAGLPPEGPGREAGATGTGIADRMIALLGSDVFSGPAPRGPKPIRALRLARHPSRTWKRIRARRALEHLIRVDASRAVEQAVTDAGGGPGQAVGFIALDGVAQLAAGSVLASGSAGAMPGGLRHLVDLAAGPDASES